LISSRGFRGLGGKEEKHIESGNFPEGKEITGGKSTLRKGCASGVVRVSPRTPERGKKGKDESRAPVSSGERREVLGRTQKKSVTCSRCESKLFRRPGGAGL